MEHQPTPTPWGWWQVLLEEPTYKLKRILVKPGQRLSYQKHNKRQEHWLMVQGEACVMLDGRELKLVQGQAIDIPRQAAHRIANSGDRDLIFIEVQTGEYFGEDDIIRLQDDYGR